MTTLSEESLDNDCPESANGIWRVIFPMQVQHRVKVTFLYYLLGALNSKVHYRMSALSPTLNFNAGDLKRIPVSINIKKNC